MGLNCGPEDRIRWCQSFPKIRSLSNQNWMSLEAGNASSGCSFERSRAGGRDQNNLLKQAQEYLASIQSQGEQARLEQQRAQWPTNKAKSNWRNSGTLRSFEVRIGNRCDPVSQEELESLTEQLAEIELQKKNLNRDIETMKSDKDVLQQKVQNLQEQLAELRLQQTEWFEPTKLWANRCSSLGRNDLPVGSRRASVAIADWTRRCPSSNSRCGAASQSIGTGPNQENGLGTRVIQKRFELDDLEGQAEDVAEQMEQARKKNEEWIRQQAKAEATREKHADRLNKLLTQITDLIHAKLWPSQRAGQTCWNLAAAENQLKSIEKILRLLVRSMWMRSSSTMRWRALWFPFQPAWGCLGCEKHASVTINDMNDEVKERFKSTFEAIQWIL